MELSILIVSYNTRELTKACVLSVLDSVAGEPPLAQNLEILIVDNHSTDGSIEVLQTLKKSSPVPITILANPTNLGFAAANNQAILQAKGEFFLLLNSDTLIKAGALSSLVQVMRSDEAATVGILSAALLQADETPQYQGGDLPSLAALFVFAFLLDDLPLIGRYLPSHQHTGRRAVSVKGKQLQIMGWVAGTAMLVRSNLVPQIGVLDEQIFMYAEDLEYCWRAKKAGWRSAIAPSSQVVHFGSKSSSPTKALEGELFSLQYVLSKHLPWWQVGIGQFLLKMAARNRALLFRILKQPAKADLYRSILNRL